MQATGKHAGSAVLLLVIAFLLAGCAPGWPASQVLREAAPHEAPTASSLSQSGVHSSPATGEATITIDTAGPATPINPRVFGSNLPAWLGPDRLANTTFQTRVVDSGVTVIRLPGGSWSNYYDWLACQQGDAEECYWPWAARPGDFLAFVRATGAEAMWTVSPNETSEQAAALVAFFNGDVDDERPIGIDLRGRDWMTVGHWARLRRDTGSPEPLKIMLWEFGNEVYGAKQDAGPNCAAWGWEDVWTCDGTEYVTGVGQGADRHEGYLEFREAMRAVDPQIMLGAVGVSESSSWSGWGDSVIAAAGTVMDFYIIHQYAFFEQPGDLQQVLAQPQGSWKAIVADAYRAFDRYADGRRVPVAVTEYNLFAVQEQDNAQLMTRAVSALFLADTLGQMIQSGITMANHWNLANGVAQNGTDYGLIHPDTLVPYPQYYVFPLWRRVGEELLPISSPFSASTELSVYAGRTTAGTYTLLAINKTAQPITAPVALANLDQPFDLRVDVLQANTLDATSIQFNGVDNPGDALFNKPAATRTGLSDRFEQTFAPYSITLLQINPTSEA